MIFTMRRTRKKLNALVRDENFIAKKSKSKRRKILIFLLLAFAREKSLFFYLILRLCSEENGSEEIRGLLFSKEL